MTVEILVPARLSLVDEPGATTAAVAAVATDLRTSATTLADVSDDAALRGRPEGWTGSASRAAGGAATEFGRGCDVAVAALTRGAAAVEAYGDRLERLLVRRVDLNEHAAVLNSTIGALQSAIRASTGDDLAALQHRSRHLRAQVATWEGDVRTWWSDLTASEDRLIAALQAVDTVSEGQDAADDPSRADAAALRRELARRKGDPAAVAAWWRSLTRGQREALVVSDPGLVGGTDGIPVADRDDANRTALRRDLDLLEGLGDRRTPAQDHQLTRAQAARDALARGGNRVDPTTGLPLQPFLLLYDPTAFGGDGAAAVAYGNPDTAANVSVGVPGIMNDGSSVDGNAKDALKLWDKASADGTSVSSIAWIGYDSPDVNAGEIDPHDPDTQARQLLDILTVTGEKGAETGGHHLADFVSGLRATHQGDPAHLTVIGHSYGSTTVAHALADGMKREVDDAVLIGSPGAGGGVDSADDLMPRGHLFVGSKDRDFVTWLGHQPGEYSLPPLSQDLLDRAGLGEDPAQRDFGATRFDVGAGNVLPPDPLAGAKVGLDNHTSYYEGRSLSTMADVVAGRGVAPDQVVAGRDVNGAGLAARAELEGQAAAARGIVDVTLRGAAVTADGVVDVGTTLVRGAVTAGTEAAQGVHELVDGASRLRLPDPGLPVVPRFSGVFR